MKNETKKGENEDMNLKDKIEYIVIVISEFARQHKQPLQQAYHYLKHHRGIEFLDKSYDVEHLFSIEDAVDDLTAYCRRQEGAQL